MLARTLSGRAGARRARSLSGRPARREPLRRHGDPARRRLSAPAAGRATSTCCWCRPRTCDERVLPLGRAARAARRRRARPTRCSCRARPTRRAEWPRRSACADVVHVGGDVTARRGSCVRAATLEQVGPPAVVVGRGRHRAARAILRARCATVAGRSPDQLAFRDHHWFTRARRGARGAGGSQSSGA